MATNAKLLGTSIHEIQASWMGLEEIKQANYTLRALPKGLKFLHAIPPSESPKVMGLMGIHDPDMERRARMRGPWSITYELCTAGWAWCATDVMIAHLQHLTLSTDNASRTVTYPKGKS